MSNSSNNISFKRNSTNYSSGKFVTKQKILRNMPHYTKPQNNNNRIVLSSRDMVKSKKAEIVGKKNENKAITKNNDYSDVDLTNLANYNCNRYTVAKNSWYEMTIKIAPGTPYKKGLIKILEGDGKVLAFPIIKLPNIIYSNLDKVDKLEDLNRIIDYSFFIKTGDYTMLHVYSINLQIKNHVIKKTSDFTVLKGINFYRLRRLFDLDLINYYLGKLDLNLDKTFVDRFKSEYALFKNPFIFDNYMATLNVNLRPTEETEDKFSVLYLINSSIQYENIGYTVRTHSILTNTANDYFKIYGVTRYGYPYDRDVQYYNNQKPKSHTDIDKITYIKLLNNDDNYNNNNLEEYLKKYIRETIKLANNLNAKVIHATTNFWNGIAAIYAAQYLGIKSVYEIRGFWEESSITYNPELYDSDLLRMRRKLENLILERVDKVICINDILKEDVLSRRIDEDKVEVLPNGVNTTKFLPNSETRDRLKKDLNLTNYNIIIGYIGSILSYEGLEYIVEAMQKIKQKYDLSCKFILLGEGNHKDKLDEYTRRIKMTNNVMYLGKKSNEEIPKFYDIFDIVIYPRKNLTVCNTTSSSKILEAMSMAKPIIVSRLKVYDDVINENVTGLYCEPDDVEDLVDKIMLLYNDKDLSETIGQNARSWVTENREWKILGNEMRDIYLSL